MDKYKFRLYDKRFPLQYRREKAKLIKILPKNTNIEHVGSTAVLGLGGKGIIDIAIMAPKSRLKKYMTSLEKIGFEYSPDHPRDDRRVFMQKIIRYGGRERRIHVHLCSTEEFYDSFIVFRDYLRKNDNARNEYTRIKKEGVKYARGNGEKYRKAKEKYLKILIKKALHK